MKRVLVLRAAAQNDGIHDVTRAEGIDGTIVVAAEMTGVVRVETMIGAIHAGEARGIGQRVGETIGPGMIDLEMTGQTTGLEAGTTTAGMTVVGILADHEISGQRIGQGMQQEASRELRARAKFKVKSEATSREETKVAHHAEMAVGTTGAVTQEVATIEVVMTVEATGIRETARRA